MQKESKVELRVLYTVLPLFAFYQFMEFQQNPSNRFEVIHRTMQLYKEM